MDTTNPDHLDQADMARLAAGNDAALNLLMDRHATSVFHFLFRMLGNEADANDLAQETFVRVYQARASYHPRHKFSAWLFTIAANLARNHLRWRARHPNLSLDAEDVATGQTMGDTLPAETATPPQSVDSAERLAAVQASVQSLPEDLREAIVLCEWQELSMAEAAEVLGTTVKAVESRLYRARQTLKQKLKSWI